MGNLFGGGSSAPAASSPTATTTSTSTASLGPYPDDGAKRMPVFNSPSSIEAGRKRRREIVARSGRESTRLVGNAGTRAFENSFLGDTA